MTPVSGDSAGHRGHTLNHEVNYFSVLSRLETDREIEGEAVVGQAFRADYSLFISHTEVDILRDA